jgi:DNA-binding CsgD family transcriptional regulator
VCSLYRLTTTEASLVCHLVLGRTIAEAAEQMRIRTQTARAYLKQIFVKTNTHRQADLIRLILNSFAPLA